ncbi:uncharacterized protein LOC144746004 [Ciona intestinalis]
MTTASGWAYYYKIRSGGDHMDTLKLYKDYKECWDKHRIPGETKLNEVLWEDPWWKIHNPLRRPRKLPPIYRSRERSRTKTTSPTKSVDSRSTLAPIPARKGSKASQKESDSEQSSSDSESETEENVKPTKVVKSENNSIILPSVDIEPEKQSRASSSASSSSESSLDSET